MKRYSKVRRGRYLCCPMCRARVSSRYSSSSCASLNTNKYLYLNSLVGGRCESELLLLYLFVEDCRRSCWRERKGGEEDGKGGLSLGVALRVGGVAMS